MEASAFEAARARVQAARLDRRAQAHALGIDAAFIDRLVETFYARIQSDARLGPIFAARVTDWPPHLARMKRFWASVLLTAGTYEGRPMPAHVALPAIEEAEFAHWLALFHATLAALTDDPRAIAFVEGRARMIASSLLAGIRQYRDGETDPARLAPVFR